MCVEDRILWGGSEDEGFPHFNVDINQLKDRDREGRGLYSTGLGLSNDIVTLDYRDDGALLARRRSFETVGVDTPKELGFELHGIEVAAEIQSINQKLIKDNETKALEKTHSTTWSQLDSMTISSGILSEREKLRERERRIERAREGG